MIEILEELNPWWKNKFNSDSISRPKYLDLLIKELTTKNVTILTGIRRVGKTTLMKQLISHLLGGKINPKNILFLSLDLLYFNNYSIYDIVLEYKKIHKISNSEKVYLFLDEITYKKSFNQELKNLYDLGNYVIFASSSSAKVLKDNKAFLTGRSRYFEVFPLDFKEYLLFNNYTLEKTDFHILVSLFDEYMEFGGMPEYVLNKDQIYLSELLELIISKDIISAHNIRNTTVVYDLFKLLCERVGKQISYNKLSKILEVDNETVSRYVSYFLDTYLFDLVEVKGKLNERIKGSKKLYCIDVGLRNIVTGFRDKGAVYENLVFNKIKKFSPNFFYKNGIEIDFCFGDTLIEAKYGQEMNKEQRKLFDNSHFKQKIVAQGVEFFINDGIN